MAAEVTVIRKPDPTDLRADLAVLIRRRHRARDSASTTQGGSSCQRLSWQGHPKGRRGIVGPHSL
jgi:hypothetical protein